MQRARRRRGGGHEHRSRSARQPARRPTSYSKNGHVQTLVNEGDVAQASPCAAAPWSATSSGAKTSARPMIDRGTADYYLSFEWLEGLRRLVYTNKDTVVLANDWRIDPVAVSSGQAEYPAVEASGTPCGNAAPRSTSSPPPHGRGYGNARDSTASSWASCPCSWAGRGRLALRRGGHRRPQGTRPERQGL